MGIERPEREPAPQAVSPRAGEPPRPSPPPPPGGWYGGAATLTDIAAVGLVVTAFTEDHPLPLLPGYLSYLMGAPISHLAHGQGLNAGISLAARATPIVLSLALLAPAYRDGLVSSDRSCRDTCELFLGTAFVLPPLVALIDDLYLARYPEPEARPAAVAWTPLTGPVAGGWTVGAAGRW